MSVMWSYSRQEPIQSTHLIVFTEEMYETAVNDNTEDLPKVAVD